MPKKILFILGATPDYIPYVYNYFRIAESLGASYDVVCWNRYNTTTVFPNHYCVYNHTTRNDYSAIKKLIEIFHFTRFVRKNVSNKEYDLVFTCTIADSLFFTSWLTKKYKGRYIFDIRDHSPLLKFAPSKLLVKKLLRHSAMNVISSEGFKRWLPSGFDYCLCHNVSFSESNDALISGVKENKDSLCIITIGSLRDFDSNSRIIDEFANLDKVSLRFAGTGSKQFSDYCAVRGVNNVIITDSYKKTEEDDIVREADIVNLFLPHTINSDSCLGNRMYLAARLHKPLIVTSGSFQAEVVREYNLGVCVDWGDSIKDKVIYYWGTMDRKEFEKGCDDFMNRVHEEMKIWENKVVALMG